MNYFGVGFIEKKVLFLGLDAAGKTTLLQMLSTGTLKTHSPTFHPASEELILGQYRVMVHDMGGHAAARQLWDTYLPQVDGIVYMVDAVDSSRFPESKRELMLI